MRTGDRFRHWTVISKPTADGFVLCRCDCGKTKSLKEGTLRYGKSDGCSHCRQLGPKHRRWRGDLVSPAMGRKRARSRFNRDSGCVDCGKPAHDLHHEDGNPLNNEPDNVTPLCRSCHMRRDGRSERLKESRKHVKGSGHGRAKLVEESVIEIRRRHAAGENDRALLAKEYGVSKSTIDHVLSRATWQHV